MVAAGEGLEWDQGGVVAEQNLDVVGGVDPGLIGAADEAFPAAGRAVQPVDEFDPAERGAAVDELGEGGGTPARGGEVGAGGDGAALTPTTAEVDRDERQAGGTGQRDRRRRQGPGRPCQRPAIGRDKWVVGAGVGQARAAGEPLADRARQAPARIDLAPGRDGGDRDQEQQGDERRQSRLLDARRSPLPLFPVPHGSDARAARRTGGALNVKALCRRRRGSAYMGDMEGSPFNLFGDPDEFRARMEELSEQMQSSQRVAWADNAIKLAVEMTVASIGRLDLTGNADEQAMQVRDAIRVLFPEAVTLVREAREGLS